MKFCRLFERGDEQVLVRIKLSDAEVFLSVTSVHEGALVEQESPVADLAFAQMAMEAMSEDIAFEIAKDVPTLLQ